MPSRKHHEGGPKILRPERKTVFEPVTNEDRKNFGGLALWAAHYVNYVYDNAGNWGDPVIERRWIEAITWIPKDYTHEDHLWVNAKGRFDLKYPRVPSHEEYEEYKRQQAKGVEIVIEKSATPYPEEGKTSETLSLIFDADEVIVGGSYRWYGSRDQDQPAKDGHFGSIDDAHTLGVTARGAVLLGEFRDASIAGQSRVEYAATLNQDKTAVPDHLIELPEFV